MQEMFPVDVFLQLGLGGAHLPADPALSPQLLRFSSGHLVAVRLGDVLQEDRLRQAGEQHALPRTELAAVDLKGINMLRDSYQTINIPVVQRLYAVLLDHVVYHIFEFLKSPAPLLARNADVAVEELVGMDLPPTEKQ